MKVVATLDGLALVLTAADQHDLVKQTANTEYTPRQVLERLAQNYSMDFERAAARAVKQLTQEGKRQWLKP